MGPIHAVLDRRRRQLALRALARELHHPATLPEPPPAKFVVSVACFIVGTPAPASGRDVVVEGETIATREVRVATIRATGSGPIDVYIKLALLLGGTPYSGPAATTHVDREPFAGPDPEFPLAALEPLVDADPFVGEASALEQAELVDVYPIERHLFAFVDAFRRAYLPQRGRL
jgi:hypothetical protein